MKDLELINPGFNDNILIIKHFFEKNNGVGFLFAVSDSFRLKQEVNDSVIIYSNSKGKEVGVLNLNLDTGLLLQFRNAKELYKNGLIINNIDQLILETNGDFFSDFNLIREGLISLKIPLLIWLNKQNHETFTQKAFDLYLRRDLSTLFFQDPINNENSFLERFTDSTRESSNFEETKTRIALLELQLQEARSDSLSKSRLTNEIVLPLVNAYIACEMLNEANKLIGEFESDFENNKITHIL